MILTKDNLLKFVKERKYVLPSDVSEAFQTTILMASAALSELVNQKLLGITYLKKGSSPFYYDLSQKEALEELGEKLLKKYEKEVFERLRKDKIINDMHLSAPERVAIMNLKDFATPLEIEFNGSTIKFWLWYMLDVEETRQKILEAISISSSSKEPKNKETKKEEKKEKKKEIKTTNNSKEVQLNKFIEGSKEEDAVEAFFRDNGFKIINKIKKENSIFYEIKLENLFPVVFEALLYIKKPTESEIIKFYTSSLAPKIVFAKNISQRVLNLKKTLKNLFIYTI